MKRIFGPVPSRRLGFSLGVDPVVPKTCTLDCVYCELGPTTDRTVCRRPYVRPDAILEELEQRLTEDLTLDFVTLSGSGEPTLNSEIGVIMDGIRGLTDVPIAVLTNGTLLADPDVRSALLKADVVAPSLDAVSQGVFESVNRPDPSLKAGDVVGGLLTFASQFTGQTWLETLFVAGLNDDYDEVERIAEVVSEMKPERVHVNTVLRPPAEANARPVSSERLKEIAGRLGPTAEVIAGPVSEGQRIASDDVTGLVLAMAARRPVTSIDIARSAGVSLAAAAKIVDELVEKKLLAVVRHDQRLYYRTCLERGCQ
ncbi:MAG: radical SAM protein [Candidatus Eisenbacteria bacterium]|nr:radical SAM protein [Candidatus Eisenbacteria bacterium]